MAQTFSAAFSEVAEVEGVDFDLAVGLEKPRPQHRSTPEVVRQAWASFTASELQRMAEQLVGIVAATNIYEAEDAIQDTFAVLWVKHPELFAEDPWSILGIVSNYARKRLMKIRDQRGPKMLSLDLSVDPKSDADPEREGSDTKGEISPVVAYTRAGVDEDARFTPPPGPGQPWERLQVIGVVQRWRDHTGKAPASTDLRAAKGMPTMETVKRLGWENLNDLLLEAGVPIERPTYRKRWTALEAAETCYAFRRREGFWPGRADAIDLPPGSLPSYETMIRYFGGATPQRVQAGCEAILGPIDVRQPEPTKLTTRLRSALKSEGGGFPSMIPVPALSEPW